MNRRAPYSHLSAKEQSALITRAFGTSDPALRAENDRRAEERDRAYREQYGLPPARWDRPQFTRLTPTAIGHRVDDDYLEAAE